MTRFVKAVAVALLAGGLALGAAADSITVDGKEYADVLVREGRTMYYVQVPDEGRVFSVRKDAVDPGSVVMTSDAAQRRALSDSWKASKPESDVPVAVSLAAAHAALATRPKNAAAAEAETIGTGKKLVLRGTDGNRGGPAREERDGSNRSDGYVSSVNIKDAPLGEALKAVLRPMNLDYKVQGNHLFISSPERLRKEADEPLETRTYPINDFSETALPKIVLRNPAPVADRALAAPQGYGRMTGSYGASRRSFGNAGGYGGRYGSTGAYGGSGGSAGGYRGYGGFGGGYGGLGAGYGRGGSDVTAITNISDLFSNIDDRMVGETPAVIGYEFQRPRR